MFSIDHFESCGSMAVTQEDMQVSFSCVSGACTEELHSEQAPPFQANILRVFLQLQNLFTMLLVLLF